MNDRGTSIYDIQGIKKSYGNHTILNIRRLEFHRGTIYGIIGPIGSGKSTLFNILAGLKKPNEGVVKYDDAEFETNWMGKLKTIPEIALANIDSIPKGSKVSDVIKSMDKNRLEKRAAKYFNNGSLPFLLNRKVSDLSPGELAWINMIIAVESDPRVLMIDDYGVFFDTNMESDFRKKTYPNE
jgi:ABC-type multidrug transport system ATPase subunit